MSGPDIDLIVVGAGPSGLAHAVQAHDHGLAPSARICGVTMTWSEGVPVRRRSRATERDPGSRSATRLHRAGGDVIGVDLYWIPLGAGARVVRCCGRTYEALRSLVERREVRDLYHSALVVTVPEGRYYVEVAPIPRRGSGEQRGVVAQGAVGSRHLGRLRIFRYELRRWLDGEIPDIEFAVGGSVHLADDEPTARRVLDLVARVPMPVWGRDELHAGEMWNSNSVVSWVLERAGLLHDAGSPPPNGRAPGWDAGMTVARREEVPAPPLAASLACS